MTIPKIPLRTFCVELKHRPADDTTGDREELIHSLELTVPRLGNSALETRWVTLSAWHLFSSDFAKARNVNQIFVFTANWQELLIRMELNKFVDEECKTINPPDQREHDQYNRTVEKKFQQLYGISLGEWLRRDRAQAGISSFNKSA